ncbi:hypothetical protein [Brevibacillus sp. SYSU BS000544]|uniref:hypothetical protein n=1 Tax=Brevibacillus sp. SYSU BS000544 TaxID=3416443 RepID=UPI003CE4A50A
MEKGKQSINQEIQYEGDLSATLSDTADQNHLGLSYSPIQAMWQVNPGSEALPQDEERA